jgi:hypothetical protein
MAKQFSIISPLPLALYDGSSFTSPPTFGGIGHLKNFSHPVGVCSSNFTFPDD